MASKAHTNQIAFVREYAIVVILVAITNIRQSESSNGSKDNLHFFCKKRHNTHILKFPVRTVAMYLILQ